MSDHTLDVEIGRLVSGPMLECPPDTSVTDAARLMAERRCSAIVVMEGERAVGIWTERDALAVGDDASVLLRPISAVMSHPVQSLPAQTRLGDAAVHFKSQGIRHCLVADTAGRSFGILTQTDLVMSLGAEFFLRAKSIESANALMPVVADSALPMQEIRRLMRDRHLSAIVIRYPNGEYGILTERDIVRLVASGTLDGAAGAYASYPLRSLAQSRSLFSARQYLIDHRMRHIGVLDDAQRLVGLLSLSDILSNIEYEYVRELQVALRQRDEALLKSRYNLRLADRVFESTLDGVMVTDLHGNIERVNPAFTRLTGFSQSEVLGRNARLLSSGRQSAEFYRSLWESLRETGHWQGEIWNRRKDGELYLEYLSIRDVGQVAQTLLNSIGGAIEIGGQPVFVTPSIGISMYPGDGTDARQLLMQADQFITVAEESALIVPIGAWVLREACRQARAWLDEGFEFGRIAVNLSGKQCRHDSFLQDMANILSETGLPARRLQFELVESMAMTAGRGTIENLLREIAGRGISLAVDDFGTGYSSFRYLQALPVDTLKVDRSFLAGVGPARSDGTIVRAIVAMAKSLGIMVVAEGVETASQLAFLRQICCDRAQGYLLAVPSPPQAMPRVALAV
jgi:PAS domain S-box-containing protein